LFTDRTTQGWMHGADDPPVRHQLRSGQELVEGETQNLFMKQKLFKTKSKLKIFQLTGRIKKHILEILS
jgi:hypothetical protein